MFSQTFDVCALQVLGFGDLCCVGLCGLQGHNAISPGKGLVLASLLSHHNQQALLRIFSCNTI